MSAVAAPRLYECSVPGFICEGVEFSTTIFAQSASKARYQCLLGLHDAGWDGINFQHIRVRSTSSVPARKLDAFAHTAKYRGLPFARIGMKVEVGGHPGVIVGPNDSANFDVFFTGGPFAGSTLNCHPNWSIRYFDESGKLLASFEPESTAETA